MATWQEWVSDKVKDSLNSGDQNSYYHLIPRRNPHDPFDEAVAGAAGAIGNEATKFRFGPFYQPPRANFAPPEAIDPDRFNRPTMEASIDAARKSLGIPMPEAVPLDEAMAKIGAMPGAAAKPAPDLAVQPGDYTENGMVRSAGAAAIPPSQANFTAASASAPMTDIRGGNLPTRWDMARSLMQNGVNVPLMSREEMVAALQPEKGVGGLANVGTMPDRQLRDLMDQRGLSYYKMTDEEMRKASARYMNQGTAVNPGGVSYAVPAEKAQAYEARARELSATGMKSDQALSQAAMEMGLSPEASGQRPTSALFTGGDFGAGSPEPPTYKQALQTALQMFTDYAKNPEKYGPHYAQNIISAIQHLPVSEAVPESTAAENEYRRANAQYALAHAGLAPSEIEKNLATAEHLRAEGANKPFLVPPGYEAYQASRERGNPATRIATGAAEKAATPGVPEKMSDVDKTNLAHAWDAYKAEMDPKEKAKLGTIIQGINNKYTPTGPAGPKPPVAGATLRKHPTTGADVWVGPDGKIIPLPGEEEAIPTGEKPAKGKKTMWEHLNAPAPGLSMLQALIGQ